MTDLRFEKPSCIKPDMARHALLEASAGTGKTWVIERLVVEMLLQWNIPIERILVVTFTRRAASEMATRIRQCLDDMLAGRGATAKKGPCWVLDATARQRLQQALADFDQAPISTIHTFCQRVLDEQEILTGRLREAAPTDLFSLFHEAFTASLRAFADTPSREDAVLREWLRYQGTVANLETLLFKTRSGLEHVRPVVDDARLEKLRKTLVARLGEPLPDEETLEAAGAGKHAGKGAALVQVLAEHAKDRAQLDVRAFQVGFLKLTRDTLGDKGFELLENAGGLTSKQKALFGAIAALYAELPSIEAVALFTFLPGVLERFEGLCRLRGGVDFDRLLVETHRALEQDSQHLLLERLRSRYQAVLVDEFQDTDETQWRILRAAFVADQAPTRFVAVGDPKQAIYSFRGGDLATYLLARDGDSRTKRSLQQVDRLADNWRSTAAMVKAYNLLLATPHDDEPFLGPEAEGVRYEPVNAAGKVGRLVRRGEEEPPFGLFRVQVKKIADGQAAVRAAVVAQAKTLLDGTFTIQAADGTSRPVRPSDLMVLVDNNPFARAYVHELNAAGVPAEQYRAAGLMKSPEAEEVCDLLAALSAPARPGSMLQAMRTLFFDVSLEDLDTASALPATDERIVQWHALLRAAEGRRWVELFSLLRNSAALLRRKSFNAQAERELLTLHAVLDAAHQLARDGCPDIASLAQRMRALNDVPGEGDEQDDDDIYPASEGPSAVRVLTVFKAKGLEAPIVFLAIGPKGAGGGFGGAAPYHEGTTRLLWVGDNHLRPEAARIELEADLEARRFQYVALTRAKYQLWMPYLLKAPSTREPALKPYGSAGPRFRAINERLFRLLQEQPKTMGPLCRIESGPFEPQPEQAPLPPPTSAPPAPSTPQPAPKQVREQARGLSIESFSSLALPFVGLPEKPAGSKPKDTEMAKGAGAGRAIHALLENAPLEATKPGQPYEAWLAHPKVKRLLDDWWARTRQRPLDATAEARIDHAQRLVFHALHDTLPLPGGARVEGLGALGARFHREVPFDLPWPSAANPFGASVTGRWTIDRGFLTGIIDFAFELDGRAYFGDWKSNCLERYDEATLRDSVNASYLGQVRIYSLALCRLHGIHTEQDYAARFGGALYVYLRGLGTPGAGACTPRPEWRELEQLDTTLRAWAKDPDARPKLSLLPTDAPVEFDEDDDEAEENAA